LIHNFPEVEGRQYSVLKVAKLRAPEGWMLHVSALSAAQRFDCNSEHDVPCARTSVSEINHSPTAMNAREKPSSKKNSEQFSPLIESILMDN
jgi:hypothetical protein